MKELFRGDYVQKMDSLPRTRFRWLVPALKLKPTDQLVDFGCGSGSLLDAVHERIGHYTGVDFSPEFIDYARARVEKLGIQNARFECAQVVDFCARHPREFDVAVTVDFAGYLDDAEFVRVYSAIKTCLKPEGRLFLYMANGGYFLERLKRHGLAPVSAAPYLKVRTGPEYQSLLGGLGFQRVDVTFTPHYNGQRWLHPLHAVPYLGHLFEAKALVRCE